MAGALLGVVYAAINKINVYVLMEHIFLVVEDRQ